MQEEQIQQQLDWLDDRRKKDSQVLETILERLTGLEKDIKSTDKKVTGLPAEISRVSEKASRINQLDDALVKQREDIARQLTEFNQGRENREKQKEALEKKSRDLLQKDISALQKELSDLQTAVQKLQNRELDDKRLSDSVSGARQQVDTLNQAVEEAQNKIAAAEEGRKYDMRMMSELSADVASVKEKQEKHLVFQENNESRARRIEEQVSKIVSREGERLEEMDLWMQQQQSRLLDFERSWKDWLKKFEAFDIKADRIGVRVETYQKTYLSMKQVGQEMTELMDKLERRVTEIAEMQRLSEEKLKKELNVFLAENQKRFNMYKLTYDELWREHERVHDKLDDEVQSSGAITQETFQSQKQVERISRKQVLDLLAVVRDWAADMES